MGVCFLFTLNNACNPSYACSPMLAYSLMYIYTHTQKKKENWKVKKKKTPLNSCLSMYTQQSHRVSTKRYLWKNSDSTRLERNIGSLQLLNLSYFTWLGHSLLFNITERGLFFHKVVNSQLPYVKDCFSAHYCKLFWVAPLSLEIFNIHMYFPNCYRCMSLLHL